MNKIRKKTHNDLPATVGLVKEVRSELRAELRSLDSRMDALEAKIDGVNDSLNAKIDGVNDSLNAKIDGVNASLNAKIDGLEGRLNSKIEKVLVSVHRTEVLMEEQRGENRIVLDGLKTVLDRQDRLEQEFARHPNP